MKLLKISLLLTAICFAGCKKNDVTAPNDPTPQHHVTPTFVILGSSTAAGDGANPIDSSWVKRMTATINKDTTKANVINLASAGYVTYQAMPTGSRTASRPDPDTTRNITKALSYKPALVIIAFPSNDIANNYSDEEIMGNYARMTHMLDSAKVQYIVGGTQPRNFATADQKTRLKTLNDKIISAYNIHVDESLDQLSNPDYSIKTIYSAGDGIHLNNAGHNVIYVATMKQPVLTQMLGLK